MNIKPIKTEEDCNILIRIDELIVKSHPIALI